MTEAERNIRRVHKLWNGGEKFRAVALANELKLAPKDRPAGEAAFVAGMRKEFREQL